MNSSASPNPRRLRGDPVLTALLILAAFLLLLRLANGVLWQDEAESAVLAQNVLRFGYPKADDGLNRLNPSLSLAEGSAWTYHPWASFYLTAFSFLLFGQNTTAARLPSAVLGLFSIGLTAGLIRRLTGDRALSRWTAFLLVLSVPFLLHMRQCRYYAPTVFLSLWVVWASLRLWKERRWAALELLTALLLLFHTHHGIFVPLLLGLTLYTLWTQPATSVRRSFIGAAVLSILLCLPFAFYLQAGQHGAKPSWKEISHHAQFYFRQINTHLLPVVLWGLLLVVWKPKRREILGAPGSPLRQTWKLALCLLGTGFIFLILGPAQRHFRYLIYLIPWVLFVHAVLILRLIQNRPKLGWAVAAVVLLTDLPHSAPNLFLQPGSSVRSLPLEMAGELTHQYRGPMDGVVELLAREGKSGQTVKIPYEDHTLLFYTPWLQVEPIVHPEDFARETFPDWIILRRDWLPGGFLESDYFRRIQTGYREIVLDAPDIPWQNRPDPGYHRFRSDRSAPLVRVFRKT